MEPKITKGLDIIDCSKHLEMREVVSWSETQSSFSFSTYESIPKSFYRVSLIQIFFCY